MKKLLILLAIVSCIVLCACEGGADVNQDSIENNQSFEEKSSDSISVDNVDSANKTQNEMNDSDVPDGKNEETIKIECTCNCQCSKTGIDMADAILIAQGHLFAMKQPEFSLDLVYSAKYIRDDEKTWTILVSMYDVNLKDEYINTVFGGGYTYVIDKATGRILEIRAGE